MNAPAPVQVDWIDPAWGDGTGTREQRRAAADQVRAALGPLLCDTLDPDPLLVGIEGPGGTTDHIVVALHWQAGPPTSTVLAALGAPGSFFSALLHGRSGLTVSVTTSRTLPTAVHLAAMSARHPHLPEDPDGLGADIDAAVDLSVAALAHVDAGTLPEPLIALWAPLAPPAGIRPALPHLAQLWVDNHARVTALAAAAAA